MRILMLVLNVTQKATYRRAHPLAVRLAQLGHQVTLIATSRDRRLGIVSKTSDRLTLVESPDLFQGSLRSGWDPWNVLSRISWLSKQPDYDIVHAFECRPTVIYPAKFAARRANAPLVIDWADWFGKGGSVEERPNPLIRAILRPVETYFEEHYRPSAAGNTVICKTLQDRAVKLGVDPERLLLLFNGADTHQLKPLPQAEARQQTGLPSDAFIIGYVGSIFKRDAELMGQAFDRVSSQIPEARLLLVGRPALDIDRLVLNPDRMIQTGFVEERALNPYLAASDIFWLPLSDTDANRGRFPLKLTDYLAVGRPVVASSVGDVTDVLHNEPVGLLSPATPQSFAQKTLLLYQDPGLREEMGKRGRILAETKFNWDHLARKLEDFYTQTIQQSNS